MKSTGNTPHSSADWISFFFFFFCNAAGKLQGLKCQTHMPAKCNQWVINVCPLHYKRQWQCWISAQLKAADHCVVVALGKINSQQTECLHSSWTPFHISILSVLRDLMVVWIWITFVFFFFFPPAALELLERLLECWKVRKSNLM